MSRLRTIKPGFFLDEELAECHPLARILFAGLWTIADREGRLEDRPRRIKAECLPYDDCDIDELLFELQRHGFIVRYGLDGLRFIAIPTWLKHQNPHVSEKPSTIPEPDENSTSTVVAPVKNSTSTVVAQFNNPPSCLGSCLVSCHGSCLVEEHMSDSDEPDVIEASGDLIPDDRFEEFWAVYPRHENQRKARAAWARVTRANRELAIGVATIMGELVATGQHERRYVPHPTTFIHGERWEDWREGVPAGWGDAAGEGKQAAREASLQAAMEMYRKEHPDEPL